MRRCRVIAAGAVVAAFAGLAPVAQADKEIQARPTNQFSPTSITQDQGERLIFRNLDVADHNVIADQNGPDGKPLFASATIGTNQTAVVEGTQFLTGGAYGFFCSIHPFMVGTLNVTGSGTPTPPGTTDRPPVVDVSISDKSLEKVVDRGKLKLKVTLNEAAKVTITAKSRVDRKKVTLGRVKKSLPAGRSKLSLKLKKSARKALKDEDKAKVSTSTKARDAAGNASTDKAKRTLR